MDEERETPAHRAAVTYRPQAHEQACAKHNHGGLTGKSAIVIATATATENSGAYITSRRVVEVLERRAA